MLALGVPASASPAEVQRLRLVNAMAAFALSVTVVLLPRQLLADAPASVGISLLVVPAMAGVLALQARGRFLAAALVLSLSLLTLIDLQLRVGALGRLAVHCFLAPAALLPFLVVPPRHTGAAVLTSLLASGSLVVELVWYHSPGTPLAMFAAGEPMVPVIHAAVAVGMCLLGVFARRIIVAGESTAEAERARAEALLVRVFPRAIARRLKSGRKVAAERHGDASVLFCRVIGVEAATDSAAEQLALLRELFSRFDDLCEAAGVEKIKSFGASYMVASGVPEPLPDHAERLAALALQLIATSAALRERLGLKLSLRIGIHSGPVVGGILGRRNPTFDLWGDTVNTAQRMEAHGLAGEIQVSAVTFAKINHRFRCEPREVIALKGKLAMRTYLLRAALGEEGRA